jgi:hypothetical protein
MHWIISSFAGLCSLGFLNFRQETDQLELWVPNDSDLYSNVQWLKIHNPTDLRFQQYMLVTTDDSDILTPDNLKLLNELRQNIIDLRQEYNQSDLGRSFKSMIF